jgi:Ala-tRNA(Pro) deacylase
LRDKPGRRHFLVCVPAAKQVDLKVLSDVLGASRLSFGSADRLRQHLGVEPGAVTLLAVFNDPRMGWISWSTKISGGLKPSSFTPW